ncbi:hypothetical protein F5Y08DRAFT_348519 [Xylaria arbuscula]|nr:hypothetical protein F5Y08DRAFT_348519 [Xylaria arbuscula]
MPKWSANEDIYLRSVLSNHPCKRKNWKAIQREFNAKSPGCRTARAIRDRVYFLNEHPESGIASKKDSVSSEDQYRYLVTTLRRNLTNSVSQLKKRSTCGSNQNREGDEEDHNSNTNLSYQEKEAQTRASRIENLQSILLPEVLCQSNEVPKTPAFPLHFQQELHGQVSLRRHSQRTSTRTKAVDNRCVCNDGCRSDSCVNRYTLVECHSGNCSLSWCENRYFTYPPRRLLTVFETFDGRGHGLRTDAALPTGAFVVEYIGQRCPRTSGSRSNYRMDLGEGWVLDAQNMETQARYINHACKPNCKAWKWEGADKEYHIGIFTDTEVRAGEELTIRYNLYIAVIENFHFERLNAVMQEARGSSEPFGGVQIVVTSDFHQLPPVKPFQYCLECGKELMYNRSQKSYSCKAHGVFHDSAAI